ncbi:MAG: hypothetical protein MUQ10_14935 [Anaerolineae bacterium]|nr:hypothetical protein [Anaerolineae bacterium]
MHPTAPLKPPHAASYVMNFHAIGHTWLGQVRRTAQAYGSRLSGTALTGVDVVPVLRGTRDCMPNLLGVSQTIGVTGLLTLSED